MNLNSNQIRAFSQLATGIANEIVSDLANCHRSGRATSIEVFSLEPVSCDVSPSYKGLKGWKAFFASWFRSDYYTHTFQATVVQALTKQYLEEKGYWCEWIETVKVTGYQEGHTVASLLVALSPKELTDCPKANVFEDCRAA